LDKDVQQFIDDLRQFRPPTPKATLFRLDTSRNGIAVFRDIRSVLDALAKGGSEAVLERKLEGDDYQFGFFVLQVLKRIPAEQSLQWCQKCSACEPSSSPRGDSPNHQQQIPDLVIGKFENEKIMLNWKREDGLVEITIVLRKGKAPARH
jgi:hypothetical protein